MPVATLPPPMARVSASLAVLACAAALAGCGGDEKSAGPLEEALAFFPADAPVVAAAETDPDRYRDVDRILGRLPFGDRAKERVRELLVARGLDYEKDVKPLLGNPLVFGVPEARGGHTRAHEDVVVALQVKDGSRLEEIVEKYADDVGEKEGARVYEDETDGAVAVKDDVVVLAKERADVEQALERAEGDNSLDRDTFEDALRELPDDALGRVYMNAETLSRQLPKLARARRGKWFDSLRTVGLTASTEGDAIEFELDVRTDPESLTDADLPLAAGAAAPPVVERPGELNIGLRDPSQIAEFSEALTRAAKPRRYADLQIAKRQIEASLGVDVDGDLVGQLSKNLSLSVSPGGGFGLRAEPADPRRLARTLAKVAPVIPRLARRRGGGVVAVRRRGGLYAVARPDGESLVFGVVNDVFVAAKDARTARGLASASPRPVQGAEGALVVSADAEKVANAILPRLASRIGPAAALFGPLLTSPLGELSGSARAGREGVRGSFRLTVD
jgi:Protein of unknown function (DUF3352)